MRAFHFVGAALRDGRPIPPDGETLVHEGECVLCESGLHYAVHPYDALRYAPGATLCEVEVDDIVDTADDKGVCRRRTIVRRIDATDLLRQFARKCALSVIHLWDAPDVVRQYLETGDEPLRIAARSAAREAARAATWIAARSAAWAVAREAAGAATWAAAGDAAWDAAWDAARDAAWEGYRSRFTNLVNEAFNGEVE